MESKFFRSFKAKHQCSDCGKILTQGIIYDWVQKLPWCGSCFKKLLSDQRIAAEVEVRT